VGISNKISMEVFHRSRIERIYLSNLPKVSYRSDTVRQRGNGFDLYRFDLPLTVQYVKELLESNTDITHKLVRSCAAPTL
jgi:hypothetical protein